LGGSFRFKGTVKIDIQVHSSTNEVVLNSQEIKIHDAKLISGHMKSTSSKMITSGTRLTMGTAQEPLKSSSITYDVKSQRATLVFPTELPTSEYTLVINYAGTVNNTMSGFYRSKYKPAVTPAASVPEVDGHHYMFSTQFESCDARQAFPCFDEPNLKTTFDVEIEIPEDQTALSNMPEKDVKKSKRDGFKVVAFEKTPVMSTYV
jgi:aminopeptidase N